MAHHFPIRIYYEDTDAGGVVYYANYLKFAERARSEWLRELGFNQLAYRAQYGVFFVVRHCEANYLSPAQLDDEIQVVTSVNHMGNCRIVFAQSVIDRATKHPRAKLSVTVVCINQQLRPCRIPNDLREALQGALSKI